MTFLYKELSIVLDPARSKAWVRGFDRVTGFELGQFFKKNYQADVVLVKQKKIINRLQPGF
jgi:hypothetical protein